MFKITKCEKTTGVIEVDIPNLEVYQTSNFEGASVSHNLCFSLSSFYDLQVHIGWGQEIISNQVEQGGILAGRIIKNTQNNVVYGIVEKIIPAYQADGSMKHLNFNHNVWIEMMSVLDNCKQNLIGWYHTHPKHLNVYMSNTDRNTQSLFFYEDWHFSVILNPQKKIWRVFQGKDAIECKGIISQSLLLFNN